MTGFRVSRRGQWGLDGAVEGWTPDLVTFGKVMGGGFPAAAFGGRADVMAMLSPDGPVYQAGTLSGNPVATTAGLATLRLATDEVYAHIDASASTLSTAVGEELSRAGVPHVVQAGGNMFSVFLGLEGDSVRDFAAASRQDTGAYKAFFHAMLDRGVYLPPSAYEAWFLSAAHDDRALQQVLDALPAAAEAAGRAEHGGERRAVKTIVHLLRHGEVHNPQGILYGRATGFHLSERGRRMANRVADRVGDRDITHIVSSPLERAQETATPLAAARGLTVELDERVVESGNVFSGKPFNVRARSCGQPDVWRNAVEPVPALVGRALQAGGRPDVAGGARRPRGGSRPRGRDRLPPAAHLDHPAARRGAALPARPPQAALHPVQPHLVHVRGRAAGQHRLLRARG